MGHVGDLTSQTLQWCTAPSLLSQSVDKTKHNYNEEHH